MMSDLNEEMLTPRPQKTQVMVSRGNPHIVFSPFLTSGEFMRCPYRKPTIRPPKDYDRVQVVERADCVVLYAESQRHGAKMAFEVADWRNDARACVKRFHGAVAR